MLEFLENFNRFFLEKATISKKCQKYLKMLEFLENVRIAKNVRISRIEQLQFLEISTISRKYISF